MPYNLDRIKVTIKTNRHDNEGIFHIDTLDLYQARSREAFSEACAKYLKVKSSDVMADLNVLIGLLEKERVEMLKEKNKVEVKPMSDIEKQEALDVLADKDLVKRIIEDFDRIGLVGESKNKLIGYLSVISRLLPDPMGLLILSRSGAGKTSLQDAVCKFVPEESLIQYTRLTGQSLFYRDKNALKNKVLAIEEEEGMTDALYSIRTLQSSQKLSIASTRTDAKTGKLCVEEYTVHGPVAIMISTTNPDALDPETRQRFLILTIDESEEQTRKILQMQRIKNSLSWFKTNMDESNITRLHHNMQRLLKPLTPIFPENLKIEYPVSRLQMRREQSKYLSLIKTITLLYQYQRKKGTLKRPDDNEVDYVLVSKQDIDLALELGKEIFKRNVDDVTPPGRTLLEHITKLTMDKFKALKKSNNDLTLSEVPFTRKELREAIGWSEAQVRQNITPLVDLGYIGILNGRFGSTYRYVLLDDGKADPQIEL
ncbi:MAG: hypothetical protein KKF93_04790 [Candidatus Omnitrophica bacterium]|nr:hypothetical protein [Candidatus Omnitrophota bacterium]